MTTPKKNENSVNTKVELTRILIWPVLLALFLIFNWSSVRKIMQLIPTMLTNTKTITISGLSIELNERINVKTNPEMEKSLKEMTAEDIDLLLAVSDSYQVYKKEEYEKFGADKFKSLIDKGLITKQTYSNPDKAYDIELVISENGKMVRNYLLELIKEFTKEIQERK